MRTKTKIWISLSFLMMCLVLSISFVFALSSLNCATADFAVSYNSNTYSDGSATYTYTSDYWTLSALSNTATTYTMPDTIYGSPVTTISSSVQNCSSLTSVNLNKNLSNFQSGAFSGCSNLVSISVDSANTKYKSGNNALIDSDTNIILLGCKNTTISTSVSTIGNRAFYGSGITSITIPTNITQIGSEAFVGSALTTVSNDYSSCWFTGSTSNFSGGTYAGENGLNASNLTASSAYWRCNRNFTIAFDANGGTGSTASIYLEYGQSCSLTKNGFSRTGYSFGGWATSSGGTVKHIDQETLTTSTIKDYYVTAETYSNGTYTLYAVWTAKTYSVTSGANYGSVTVASSGTFATGLSISASASEAGYNFAISSIKVYSGTNTSGTLLATISASSGTFTMSGTYYSSVYVYATWTRAANKYTITFDACGGTCTTSSITVTNGSTYGTLPTPTRTNYAFVGWYTASSGGTEITSTSTVNITNNQTLYAHWEYVLTISKDYIKGNSDYKNTFKGRIELTGASYIDAGAFTNWTGITEVVINGPYAICGSAFYGCTSLTSVDIQSAVTTIGSCAFCHCSSLTSITIPSSVTYIGGAAFSSSGLNSATFATTTNWRGEDDDDNEVYFTSSELSDTFTAADYLRDTYSDYDWYRG